jgi:hypothetical protein
MRKETIYSLRDNGVGFDDRDTNKLSAVVQRFRRAGGDGATNYFTLHKQGFMLSSR